MWKKLANRREIWSFLCIVVVFITIYNRETTTKAEFIINPHPQNNHKSLIDLHQENEKDDFVGLQTVTNKPYHSDKAKEKTAGDINEDLQLPWWDGGECFCDSKGHCVPNIPSLETSLPPRLIHMNGTCGRRASADGTGQKVISLTLFGNNPSYWNGLSDSLSRISHLYTGWKVWLYTDPRGRSEFLCPLLQKHHNFRVCDVGNLPRPLYNISRVLPTMWRITPLGDPTVSVMLVRDTDMMFTEREQAAVQDWLATGKSFHVMRDHPAYYAYILAGMWGARWDILENTNISITAKQNKFHSTKNGVKNASDLLKLRNKMLKFGYLNEENNLDQAILRRVMWPEMVGFMVSHDSFFCETFKSGWRPWPTKRINGTFVGNRWYRGEVMDITKFTCPFECRPARHLDWVSC